MRQNEVLLFYLRSFAAYAALRGFPEPLRGLEAAYPDEATMLPEAVFYQELQRIADSVGDPLLGIRTGESLALSALGLIHRISLEATTVQEAVFYLLNFLNQGLPMLNVGTVCGPDTLELRLRIDNGHAHCNRSLLEAVMTVVAKELSLMAGEALRIELSSPAWDACYPEGWQEANGFVLRASGIVLLAAIRRHERWRLQTLVPAYLDFIGRLQPEAGFAARVKCTALHLADPALPGLERVAANLNVTPRTLQRRLAAEGLTFRTVIDSLNRDLSACMLQHAGYTAADIADILGYAEPAAYIRAFKRWHGCTPRKLRQAARKAGGDSI